MADTTNKPSLCQLGASQGSAARRQWIARRMREARRSGRSADKKDELEVMYVAIGFHAALVALVKAGHAQKNAPPNEKKITDTRRAAR